MRVPTVIPVVGVLMFDAEGTLWHAVEQFRRNGDAWTWCGLKVEWEAIEFVRDVEDIRCNHCREKVRA